MKKTKFQKRNDQRQRKFSTSRPFKLQLSMTEPHWIAFVAACRDRRLTGEDCYALKQRWGYAGSIKCVYRIRNAIRAGRFDGGALDTNAIIGAISSPRDADLRTTLRAAADDLRGSALMALTAAAVALLAVAQSGSNSRLATKMKAA